MSETPQPSPDELAALMAQVQALQPPARIPAARLAEMAREVLDIRFDPEETRQLHEAQHQANEQFVAAHESLERLLAASEGVRRLAELARAPGSDRSWAHPKRWIGTVLGLVLRRQTAFNAKVARTLAALTDAPVLRQQQAALGHLVASTNTLVRRLTDLDRAAAERGRALADLFQMALERVAAAEPDALRTDGPAYTAEERETLRSLVASASEAAAGTAALRTELARHVAALTARVEHAERAHADLARTLNAAVSELRAQAAAVAPPPPSRMPAATPELPESVPVPAMDFLAFEAVTRGDEERIAREQRVYTQWFQGAPAAVLDAGCGRGEFLSLLCEAGVPAYGIDSDPRMVAYCRSKGLDAREATLFEHLDSLPDGALGGVFLGQVVEHLPQRALLALPALLHRKIAPGGRVVVETINPMCLTTFSGAMYADPTHQRPVHPKALEFLLGAAGFCDMEMVFNAPVPPDEALQPLAETAPLEPALKDLVLQANRNIGRLNALLYSYANYAMAVRKPT